jgi:VWFA-related protein
MDLPAGCFEPCAVDRARASSRFPMRRGAFTTRIILFVQAACLVAGVYTLTVRAQDQQQQPFRSGASTVAVYTTVTDSTGRLVPNLTKDDFEIYDNGKLQPITLFQTETQPLSIAIMLDRSGSMRENTRLVALGAEELVRKLLPIDKARIGSFSDKIQLDPEEFTSDQQALIRILRGDLPIGDATALWNAANEAMSALSTETGRRVVLLFTDGVDSPPISFKKANRSVMDVVERATRDDTMVYAIGFESRMPFSKPQSGMGVGGGGLSGGFGQTSNSFTQRPDPGLPKIAEETGGGYFELTRADDLKATFARVADELHQQYALGFEPTKLDGKTHKLEVKLKTKGMKARARESYVAVKARTSN